MGPGHYTKKHKYIRYRCSYNAILYIGASPVAQMVKNPPAMHETRLSSGRSPGEGNSNPLQYSCPENPMDRGA